MPNTLVWYVGNRKPSISETITINGVPFDLTSSTVKFKARALGSGTLLVDTAATIVSAPAGTVRYDWTAGDASTGALSVARPVLVWWEVTTAAQIQDMGEALIQVLAHAPVTQNYVELEDMKKTLALEGVSYANLDLSEVISAASRKVDEKTERRFWLDADANQVRIYTPTYPDKLWIDDLVTLTTIRTDPNGDGVYESTWSATDYQLGPTNAAADGRPFEWVKARSNGTLDFSLDYDETVQITGRFGWPSVPADVKTATKMIAHRYVKRLREAPHGVVGFGMDGAVVRMMHVDPDVEDLLMPYSRRVMVA